jgi:hypothetical protein
MIKRLLNKMKLRRCARALALCCAAFLSCGLDDYSNAFLNPVENVVITATTSQASLPANPNLRNYSVFYRIYLSGINSVSITTSAERNAVNAALESHYRSLEPYTNTDTVPNTIGTVFSQRGYRHLCVISGYERSLDDLLTSQSSGTLFFDFSASIPAVVINNSGSRLTLRRSSENFTPYPNTALSATSDLVDNSRITSNQNIDVERHASTAAYAYISLYIVATGIDTNFSTIYSNPKHLGVFQLQP